MGITKTADGRYQVGKGIADANNYTGALGKRDMVIQYTEDGVTAQSMEYLNFLKDYAEHHADIGELIKPSDVSIWIAKDDKLTAVEADDISYDDGTFTLSSITYDGTDWTFGEPTPGGGGGGGVPTPTAEDVGKVLTAKHETTNITLVSEQTITMSDEEAELSDIDYTMDDFEIGNSAMLTATAMGQSVEVPLTCTDSGENIFFASENRNIEIYYESGAWYLFWANVPDNTELVVSATAELPGDGVTVGWSFKQGGAVGTITITTNGEHDVTEYATANVQVPVPELPDLVKFTIINSTGWPLQFDGMGDDFNAASIQTASAQVPVELYAPSTGQYTKVVAPICSISGFNTDISAMTISADGGNSVRLARRSDDNRLAYIVPNSVTSTSFTITLSR